MERLVSDLGYGLGDKNAKTLPEGMETGSIKSSPEALKKPTHYQVLNVDIHASRLEIREAYLRLKSAYEQGSAALYSLIPDDEAKAVLQEMETAFQILSDDVARRNYDLSLGLRSVTTAGTKNHSSESGAPYYSERLMYAQETLRAERLASFGTRMPDREEISKNSSEVRASDRDIAPTTIQTSRSQLPVVKLKAEKCDDLTLAEQMAIVIGESDLADGELYKKLRELAGVSQDEMQDRTKISVGYLLALESNRLDRLPQSVYVKGFLRSYFRYIGAPKAEEMVLAFANKLAQWQAQNRS